MDWNRLVASFPTAHLLQTEQWGQIKTAYGWKVIQKTWDESPKPSTRAALILQRTVPSSGLAARLKILYIPKGPLLNWNNPSERSAVLTDLANFARKQEAIFIKIDPDVLLGTGKPGEHGATESAEGKEVVASLKSQGWRYSPEQVQFCNTVLIDLSLSESELLGHMKQKTRYNIRLAERKGVNVRIGEIKDIDLLYHMYAETSVRDGFVIRDESYYKNVWKMFLSPEPGWETQDPTQPVAQALIAEVGGEPVAAVIYFRFARKAWYMYGMSRDSHREKMPNYLLQWEAMRQAKQAGCSIYDLWGAPEEFKQSDPLWGVYRFKEGLGGQVVRWIGAWDLPIQPLLYRLYTQTIPNLLSIMRWRGKERAKNMLGN